MKGCLLTALWATVVTVRGWLAGAPELGWRGWLMVLQVAVIVWLLAGGGR